MRITILLLAWLLSTAPTGFAQQTTEAGKNSHVEGFTDVMTSFNVPYVAGNLEKQMDRAQALDIYTPVASRKPPVVLYLHGGSWAFGDKKDVHMMPYFFALQGFAFVSMNYRLRWDYRVYDQVNDVVAAIRWLAEQGEDYGLDGSRVILMGSDAGGHLAALALADSSFMKAENFDGANVRAVVSLDSISYDINRLMTELGSFTERRQHELIFTDKEQVWTAASPISHVASSSTLKPFALLYSPGNQASHLQAKRFAKTLTEASVPVLLISGADDGTSIEEQIGRKGSVATGALMAFLRSQF